MQLMQLEVLEANSQSLPFGENVPGVLSTKDNAFGCFLGALSGEECELQPTGKKWTNAGCVFGPKRAVAWRILDAQYFGLAQRRKRVFVVASAREGFHPDKVLFEWEGVRRDIAPSRSAGQDVTRSTEGSSCTSSEKSTVATLMANAPLVKCNIQENVYCGTQNDACRDVGHEISPTLRAGNNGGAVTPVANVAFYECQLHTDRERSSWVTHCLSLNAQVITREKKLGKGTGFGLGNKHDPAFTLQAAHSHGVFSLGLVRRLTPVECERLQGFPDNYTQIPYRNKPAEECPDGARYAAIGNSMAVSVMRWIGERIQKHCQAEIEKLKLINLDDELHFNAAKEEIERQKDAVDEYKTVAENLDEMYLREKQKVSELQNRIDDAIKALNQPKKLWVDMSAEAKQILLEGKVSDDCDFLGS